MILKLGMYHLGLKLYKVYINDDPGLTLTYFTFEWGKLLQSHLIEGNLQQRTLLTMKKIDLRVLSVPVPGLYTCV